jgi:hypothetical protein
MQAQDIRTMVSSYALLALVIAALLTLAAAIAVLALADRFPGLDRGADASLVAEAPGVSPFARMQFLEANTIRMDSGTVEPVDAVRVWFIEDNTVFPAAAPAVRGYAEILFAESNTILPATTAEAGGDVTPLQRVLFYEENAISVPQGSKVPPHVDGRLEAIY